MSAEEQTEVEHFAGLAYSRRKVALLTGVGGTDPGFETAYQRGQLLTESVVRQSVVEHAKNGSSPAQALYVRFLEEMRADNELDQ